MGWDEEIPTDSLKRWQAWLEDLPNLEQLTINRCFKPTDPEGVEETQLHQVLATRLDKISRDKLSIPVDQSFFWTDSTCVLRYIENQDKRFHTFVANRIAAIHNASSLTQWKYINTELNPADDALRGTAADSLERWLRGPEFLGQPEDAWPKRPADMNAKIDTDPEVKGPVICATYVSDPNPLKEIIERYSAWDRLRRIVAWILRYKTNLLRNVKRRREGETIAYESIGQVTPIEVDEIKNAETEILKRVQSESFKEECQLLEGNNQPKESRRNCRIKKCSRIFNLDPVMNEGLLQVGGRLENA